MQHCFIGYSFHPLLLASSLLVAGNLDAVLIHFSRLGLRLTGFLNWNHKYFSFSLDLGWLALDTLPFILICMHRCGKSSLVIIITSWLSNHLLPFLLLLSLALN